MAKGTTKSNGQKNATDKFYTNPEIAKMCLEAIPGGIDSFDLSIEPSAGSGSFSSLVEGCVAFDLVPEGEGIVQQDWLHYEKDRDDQEKVLVFGNPPFGQQNSLAVKFINHASMFADSIAFILPLSFKKPSVQNRLNKNLHLSFELVLPKNSFTLDGEPYNVPCVFQVWEYRADEIREKEAIVRPSGYSFVRQDDIVDFSVQRVGGRAGFADMAWMTKSIQSNYFIKLDEQRSKEQVETLVALVNNAEFPSRNHSVGPRSLSKNEVVVVLNKLVEDTKVVAEAKN